MRIARLRSIHPIYEPLAARLDGEVNAAEANAMLDRIVGICGAPSVDRDALLGVRKLLAQARALHPDPAVIKPIEAHVNALGVKCGLPPASAASASSSTSSVSEEGGKTPPEN